MPSWPVTLPECPINRSFSWAPVPNVVETDNDVGEVIARRRFTGTTIDETGTLLLDDVECEALFQFWAVDCAQGALEFTMNSWRDGVSRNYKFIGSAPPQFVSMATRFTCTLQLRYTLVT